MPEISMNVRQVRRELVAAVKLRAASMHVTRHCAVRGLPLRLVQFQGHWGRAVCAHPDLRRALRPQRRLLPSNRVQHHHHDLVSAHGEYSPPQFGLCRGLKCSDPSVFEALQVTRSVPRGLEVWSAASAHQQWWLLQRVTFFSRLVHSCPCILATIKMLQHQEQCNKSTIN